jgi:thiol-disulfide isomerase/thioredoxin
MFKRIILAIVGVAGILAAFAAWKLTQGLDAKLPENISSYAQVRLENEQSAPIALGSVLQPGAPTIMSFWASWCVPCKQEAKTLAALRLEYPVAKLNILYLNIEGRSKSVAAQKFLQQTGAASLVYHYISLADFQKISGSKVMILPRSYIFSKDGKAMKVFTGYAEGETSRDLRNAVLLATKTGEAKP